MIRHRLLGGQLLLQGARLEGRRLGLGQRALALEQLLVEGTAVRLQRRQPAVELLWRQRGQLRVMLPVTVPLALLQRQRPLPLGQTGTCLGAGILQRLQGGTARLELIRAHGQQAAQVIFGDAEAAGVGSPAPQHLPPPPAAHLLLLLQMAETGLELGLALTQGAGRPLHHLQLAGQLLQPLLPAMLDQGNLLAPQTGGAAGDQPLPLLFMLLVVALELVQQLALGLQACLLGAQGRGEAGNLAGQPLPLAPAVQPGLAGPLPLVPLLAAQPLAPGLAPHLFVEPAAPLLEALAQSRLLLAHRLHLPLQSDALAVGLLPLLLELLVLAGQLAQLLAHGLQLLLPLLGLTQLLLATGQPLLQALAAAQQDAHQFIPLDWALT